MIKLDVNYIKFRRILNRLIRCIYPERCDSCGEIIPLDKDFCDCKIGKSIKISDAYCHHCARNISDCNCNSPNSAYLSDVAAVYNYSGRVRRDIIKFKFYGNKKLAKKYGIAMADRCKNVYSDIKFDIVTFVPGSEESLKTRGYNQSRLLANYVGGMLFVPTMCLFRKIAKTENQHKLSGAKRKTNLKGSIILTDKTMVKGKNILVCDDVKTTGATLYECASLLEAAGAAKVCCICIAATDFSKKKANISPINVNNNDGDENEMLQL